MTVSAKAVQIRLPRAARAFVLGPISMSVRTLIESADLQVVEYKYTRIQDVLSACCTCQILIINQNTIDTQCSALTSLPHWVAIANLKNSECDFHTAAPVFPCKSLASSIMARSVAELVIGQIFNLARQLPNRPGFEIRHKTLGIIGYGSVGVQVSYMAEALGMRVIFYDIDYVMHYGRAKSVATLSELLGQSDIVTLHVPRHASTILNEKHLLHIMREGSYVIDVSHSRALDRQALEFALNEQHLHGAALDRPLTELGRNSNVQNLLVTYDLRYCTQEVQDAMAISSLTQLLDYLKQVADTIPSPVGTDLAMDSPATKMALAK